MLLKVIKEKGLVSHPPWISKAIQMFQLSNVFHGLYFLQKFFLSFYIREEKFLYVII